MPVFENISHDVMSRDCFSGLYTQWEGSTMPASSNPETPYYHGYEKDKSSFVCWCHIIQTVTQCMYLYKYVYIFKGDIVLIYILILICFVIFKILLN